MEISLHVHLPFITAKMFSCKLVSAFPILLSGLPHFPFSLSLPTHACELEASFPASLRSQGTSCTHNTHAHTCTAHGVLVEGFSITVQITQTRYYVCLSACHFSPPMLWNSLGLAGIYPSFRLSLGCAVPSFRLSITTDGPSALVLKGARLCHKEVQKPKHLLTTRVYLLFCPRAVWLGSPWVGVGVFSKQGLRDWAPSMASRLCSQQQKQGDRGGDHAVGFMATHHFPPSVHQPGPSHVVPTKMPARLENKVFPVCQSLPCFLLSFVCFFFFATTNIQ